MSEHTPTPWKTVKARTYVHIQDERGNCVASCAYEQAVTNAAFIVRAVNSHEELLRLLKVCMGEMLANGWSHESLEDVEQAIAKAEGKQHGNKTYYPS